jgi:hypothetical protein
LPPVRTIANNPATPKLAETKGCPYCIPWLRRYTIN